MPSLSSPACLPGVPGCHRCQMGGRRPLPAAHGCGLSFAPRTGRLPTDTRARLDAIFRAVTPKHPRGGRGAWAQLPPEHGKLDTVSRARRRWARANLWGRLLAEVACPFCPRTLPGRA